MSAIDWRGLCEELVNALDAWQLGGSPLEDEVEQRLIDRTRAALAQPEPEAMGPSDEELEAFLVDVAAENGDIYWAEPLVLARAVLARWGRPAPAPAGEVAHAAHVRRMCEIILGNTFGNGELDSLALLVGHHPDVLNASPAAEGDVAELINELRRICFDVAPCDADTITRAADLLEQRHPAPVPVAERLPGPEDCNGDREVWAWRRFDSERDMDDGDFWCLTFCEWLEDEDYGYTHWLPATALPLPQGEVQP